MLQIWVVQLWDQCFTRWIGSKFPPTFSDIYCLLYSPPCLVIIYRIGEKSRTIQIPGCYGSSLLKHNNTHTQTHTHTNTHTHTQTHTHTHTHTECVWIQLACCYTNYESLQKSSHSVNNSHSKNHSGVHLNLSTVAHFNNPRNCVLCSRSDVNWFYENWFCELVLWIAIRCFVNWFYENKLSTTVLH